jgi:hypothetical protein
VGSEGGQLESFQLKPGAAKWRILYAKWRLQVFQPVV